MLLSFERPAPPGACREQNLGSHARQGGVWASPRSLKTAQKPHRPPFDKRAVDQGSRSNCFASPNGYHRAALRTGVAPLLEAAPAPGTA
jgi:hypothetical protein